jgi:hypothetical protein
MTTPRTEAEFVNKMAIDGTAKWMDDQIAVHARAVRDLTEMRDRFIASTTETDSTATPVNVLSWFVNELGNAPRNLRFDMAVNHASALALAAAVTPSRERSDDQEAHPHARQRGGDAQAAA